MSTPTTITDLAAVAALKKIYIDNGPGKLQLDCSIPGQVTASDASLVGCDHLS